MFRLYLYLQGYNDSYDVEADGGLVCGSHQTTEHAWST